MKISNWNKFYFTSRFFSYIKMLNTANEAVSVRKIRLPSEILLKLFCLQNSTSSLLSPPSGPLRLNIYRIYALQSFFYAQLVFCFITDKTSVITIAFHQLLKINNGFYFWLNRSTAMFSCFISNFLPFLLALQFLFSIVFTTQC